MHLAIVTRCFPEDPNRIDGGVAGVTKYLVDELRKHADVVLNLVVVTAGRSESVDRIADNFTIYRIGRKGPWGILPVTLYDIFSGKRRLRSLLNGLHSDIVHFQAVTFLAAGWKGPNVLTIHGISERDAIYEKRLGPLRWAKWLLLKLTEDYARRRVQNIILISQYVRKFLPDRNRIQKTWLIPNPIADSYFDVEWNPEPCRVLCCSRVRPLKNTMGLIRAFAAVAQKYPDSLLRIAGAAEPAYLERCKAEVQTRGLGGRVEFLGNLSIPEVQDELSKASCLVLPSFQENAPLTIEEAMAVGVPVVAARVGGVSELVEDNKTGFLIDPYDTAQIADAIDRILADEELRASMSEYARNSARSRFRASVVAKETMDVYGQILSES